MEGWLFFDCFNTLLDDFDEAGDESGLGTLPDLAVALGACTARHVFVDAYRAERREHAAEAWAEHRELSLDARLLGAVVAGGLLSGTPAREVAERLLEQWHLEYPKTLRLTPGVREMLAFWHGKKRMAVISNFLVAGLPLIYLRQFGIAHHFEFVLDSAAFGYRKPGRRIFEAALLRAAAEPAQVTFIGDRLDLDIAPAHALGMDVVHLDRSADRPGTALTDARYPSIQRWDVFRSALAAPAPT
jgi:FMN phosphatase YigB (HAD superfamily)